MSANGGRGRWLSPTEAIAVGLVDAVESEQELSATEQSTLVERAKTGVMALLRAVGIDVDREHPDAIEDVNVRALQAPINASDTSKVVFEEAQRAVAPMTLKPVEDPSPVAQNSEPRQQAYESDLRSIKRLFN
jgi:hypothetical protein